MPRFKKTDNVNKQQNLSAICTADTNAAPSTVNHCIAATTSTTPKKFLRIIATYKCMFFGLGPNPVIHLLALMCLCAKFEVGWLKRADRGCLATWTGMGLTAKNFHQTLRC